MNHIKIKDHLGDLTQVKYTCAQFWFSTQTELLVSFIAQAIDKLENLCNQTNKLAISFLKSFCTVQNSLKTSARTTTQ